MKRDAFPLGCRGILGSVLGGSIALLTPGTRLATPLQTRWESPVASLTDGEIRRALKQVEESGKQLNLVDGKGMALAGSSSL